MNGCQRLIFSNNEIIIILKIKSQIETKVN